MRYLIISFILLAAHAGDIDFLPNEIATWTINTKKQTYTKAQFAKDAVPYLSYIKKSDPATLKAELRNVIKTMLNRRLILILAAKDGFVPNAERAKKKLKAEKLELSDFNIQLTAASDAIHAWSNAKIKAGASAQEVSDYFRLNTKEFMVPPLYTIHLISFSETDKKMKEIIEQAIADKKTIKEISKQYKLSLIAFRNKALSSFIPEMQKVIKDLKKGQMSPLVNIKGKFQVYYCTYIFPRNLHALDHKLKKIIKK